MWHIEELKPRVGSSSRSPWTSKMAKNQAGSTTPLLAFSLTWILAQRHTDLYLCVFQEAWSLPLRWPSWCITLLEPYQLLPPWALNPKCGDSINREFLETKSRTRWQIPFLTTSLSPWSLTLCLWTHLVRTNLPLETIPEDRRPQKMERGGVAHGNENIKVF